MSDYRREKVLRIPATFDMAIFKNVDKNDLDMEYYYPDLFGYGQYGKFQLAPTEDLFIDYVLRSDYDYDGGNFGRTRALYQSEKEKYQKIFNQIIPDCDMNKVRLVEYCWYNATEAPSYYSDEDDDFYNEV